MIATLSDSASFITVSVGNEIRVRDGQKPVTGDVQRISVKPPPVFPKKSTKDTTVKDPLTKDQVQASVARL